MAKAKILLVEDELAMIDMYKSIFEMSGFEMLVATNVKEGLKKVEQKKPDLILLDIVLGKEEPAQKLTEGFRFLKKVKENPKTKNIPVVVLTALGSLYRNESLKLGAEDYLVKSDYLPKQLVQKVEKILSKYKRLG